MITKIHEETFLEPVKLLNETLFQQHYWIFQQDSEPAHKSELTRMARKEVEHFGTECMLKMPSKFGVV